MSAYCGNFDEEQIIDTSEAYELALFPLNSVLFPTTLLPLRIFEPRYVDLIGRCMRDNMGFGIVALASGTEVGRPGQTHVVGTVARIIDFDQGQDGLLNIVIRGHERFRVIETSTESDNLLLGQVVQLADVAQASIPEEFRVLAELFNEINSTLEAAQTAAPAPTTAAQLAYGLAQYLPLPVPTKVAMLEIDNAMELLQFVSDQVGRLQRQGQ